MTDEERERAWDAWFRWRRGPEGRKRVLVPGDIIATSGFNFICELWGDVYRIRVGADEIVEEIELPGPDADRTDLWVVQPGDTPMRARIGENVKDPETKVIFYGDGGEVLRIRPDGTIATPPGITVSRALTMFIEATEKTTGNPAWLALARCLLRYEKAIEL